MPKHAKQQHDALGVAGRAAIGNKLDWILSAIGRSLNLFAYSGLDVKVVSYGGSNPEIARFIRRYNAA